jgi:ATP-dependent Lhr-like helicase
MKPVDLLDRRVASAFYGRFLALRPAQEAAIEPMINGCSVVLASGTGSGKTEAVIAPLLSRYWEIAVTTDALTVLYIAPTKALVNDLEKRLAPPLRTLGLRVGVRHGDRDDLATGATPHVLLTTPESLDVLLFRKEAAIKTVRAIVVDEVHLLYNTQRGLQLSILLKRLHAGLPAKAQWAALSATIARLPDIRDFLAGSGEEATFLSFPATRQIDAQVRHMPNEQAFLDLVLRMTDGRPTKLLMFADSRRECERLAGILHGHQRMRQGVFAHYSSLSPEVRVDTERKFAAFDTAVCISTSTLELGIDIGDIDAVLLWGIPGGVESFVQRIGGGNRRANKTNVVCLVPDSSSTVVGDALHFIALIEAARKGVLPPRSPYDLFGAIGQQILSIIASDGGRFTRVADLCELVSHKTYLDRPIVEAILSELAERGYLQHHGFKNRYGANEELHTLVDYRMIYGNLGAGSQMVDLYHGSKLLGSVPSINLLRLHRNAAVRFAGKCWRIEKMAQEGVRLQPTQPVRNALDFAYVGDKGHGDAFIADQLWQILHAEDFPFDILASGCRERVKEMRDRFRAHVSADQIPYVRSGDGIRYFTFGGFLVNKAIGLISKKAGFQAEDLSLLVPSPIDWSSIPSAPQEYEGVFHLLFEATSEQSVYQTLLPADLQLREYLQDWLRDDTIPRVLQRLTSSAPAGVAQMILDGLE